MKKTALILAAGALLALNANAQTTLYSEDFTGEDGKGQIGATIDTTDVSWSIDTSSGDFTNDSDYFAVMGGVFEGRDVDGSVFWESPSFPISGFESLTLNLDAAATGDFEAGLDVFLIEFYIDGTAQTIFNATVNEEVPDDPMFFGSTELTATLQSFSGSIAGSGTSGQIRITIDNNASAEIQSWDNISVTGTPVPEPSTYAMIAGVMVLGLAVYRRRK